MYVLGNLIRTVTVLGLRTSQSWSVYPRHTRYYYQIAGSISSFSPKIFNVRILKILWDAQFYLIRLREIYEAGDVIRHTTAIGEAPDAPAASRCDCGGTPSRIVAITRSVDRASRDLPVGVILTQAVAETMRNSLPPWAVWFSWVSVRVFVLFLWLCVQSPPGIYREVDRGGVGELRLTLVFMMLWMVL